MPVSIRSISRVAALVYFSVALPVGASTLSPVFDAEPVDGDARWSRPKVSATFVVNLGLGHVSATLGLGGISGNTTDLQLVDFDRFIRELSADLQVSGVSLSVMSNAEGA